MKHTYKVGRSHLCLSTFLTVDLTRWMERLPQCTNDQGKFWQYHNLLYGNQKQIDSGWVSKNNLKKFALLIIGLDSQKFDSCLDTAKYKAFVQNDVNLALSFGFKETPSFIIVNNDGSNPEFLQGALPFPSFEAVIDKKLSEGGNGFR